MAEPTMIYKITILELLQRSGFPLSNSQITDFFLEGDLTDYFTAQQAISDDEDAGLIVSTTNHNNTTYSITEEGKKTLELFKEKITPALSKDINKYLKANSIIPTRPPISRRIEAVMWYSFASLKMMCLQWIYPSMWHPRSRQRPFATIGK